MILNIKEIILELELTIRESKQCLMNLLLVQSRAIFLLRNFSESDSINLKKYKVVKNYNRFRVNSTTFSQILKINMLTDKICDLLKLSRKDRQEFLSGQDTLLNYKTKASIYWDDYIKIRNGLVYLKRLNNNLKYYGGLLAPYSSRYNIQIFKKKQLREVYKVTFYDNIKSRYQDIHKKNAEVKIINRKTEDEDSRVYVIG